MIRPWKKQRKTSFRNRHRAPVEARYLPKPKFKVKRPMGFHVDSDFGYQMAKSVYWQERYHPVPVFDTPEEWAQWNLQGAGFDTPGDLIAHYGPGHQAELDRLRKMVGDMDVADSYPKTIEIVDEANLDRLIHDIANRIES